MKKSEQNTPQIKPKHTVFIRLARFNRILVFDDASKISKRTLQGIPYMENTGKKFRTEQLEPLLADSKNELIVLDFSDTTYSSKWLEEVFGGLIRSGYEIEDVKERLHIMGGTDVIMLRYDINRYMQGAHEDKLLEGYQHQKKKFDVDNLSYDVDTAWS